MMSFFTDPFASEFMVRAAIAVSLLGVILPLAGTWVILRRVSYLGDALSHGMLGGIAIAYLLGVSILAGAFIAGLVMAVAIVLLGHYRYVAPDSAIGLAEITLFALGIVVIGATGGAANIDLSHILFGQLITTDQTDIQLVAVVGLAVVACSLLFFNKFTHITFDSEHARSRGIHVTWLHLLQLVMVVAAIVVSLQLVGLLLSVAVLIVPALSARLWARSVAQTMIFAAVYGWATCLGGLVVSYHLDSPPGATIALGAALVFTASSVVASLLRPKMRPA